MANEFWIRLIVKTNLSERELRERLRCLDRIEIVEMDIDPIGLTDEEIEEFLAEADALLATTGSDDLPADEFEC